MKTKFSKEEMYEAYESEVIDCLVSKFNVDSQLVHEIIKKDNLKNDFINNISDYEFTEPSKVAREIHDKLR